MPESIYKAIENYLEEYKRLRSLLIALDIAKQSTYDIKQKMDKIDKKYIVIVETYRLIELEDMPYHISDLIML